VQSQFGVSDTVTVVFADHGRGYTSAAAAG